MQTFKFIIEQNIIIRARNEEEAAKCFERMNLELIGAEIDVAEQMVNTARPIACEYRGHKTEML